MRSFGRRQRPRTLSAFLAAALMLFAWAPMAPAQDGGVRLELNKLEPMDGTCRAYLLFENRTSGDFQSLKLDLVMFDAEGIINKRLAVEGGPLPAGKTSVKLFDIEGVACDAVARVLLNGVLSCSDAEGDRNGCLELIDTASKSSAEFFK